jgi:hypothetical protein
MCAHEASSAMQKRMFGRGRSFAEAARAADNAEYPTAPPAAFKNHLRETRERFISIPPLFFNPVACQESELWCFPQLDTSGKRGQAPAKERPGASPRFPPFACGWCLSPVFHFSHFSKFKHSATLMTLCIDDKNLNTDFTNCADL